MTYSEIKALVSGIGLPYAYDHFAEGECPAPPWIVFLLPGTDNFSADNVTYAEITEVAIELYQDGKYPPNEKLVENVLDAYEIPWEKTEVWISDEKLYEVRYEFNVLYEPDDSEDDPDESRTIDVVDDILILPSGYPVVNDDILTF